MATTLISGWSWLRSKVQPSVALQEFRCPLPHTPRIAVLAPGFRSSRQIRCFPEGFTRETSLYQPELLAGHLPVLRHLARSVQTGVINLTSLTFAVVVLTEVNGTLLSPEDRTLLWNAFGVPVFEQLVSADMETLATECDAHCGLHVIRPGFRSDELAVATVETSCACGQPGERLVAATPKQEPLRALAKRASQAA